mmetsp:Transcript_16768/g.32746  ORF Transcript_16768/g.32746 Transcript_16768/m.32746 type:complete len:220 (-) Transcript_16768:262-921(-)
MSQSLWCGHDDGGVEIQRLRQSQLDVTRARREVHDQIVKIAPVCVGCQALNNTRCHRAAHDGGLPQLLVGGQGVEGLGEAIGHQLHVQVHRCDDQVLRTKSQHRIGWREHCRERGPVDVCIENTNAIPLPRQGVREVHAHGALSYPSLARGHRNRVFDEPQPVRLRSGLGGAPAPAPPLGRGEARGLGGHRDAALVHPGELLNSGLTLLLQVSVVLCEL